MSFLLPKRGAVSLITIVRLNNNALEPKALVDSTWNRLRGVQVENVPDVFYDLFRAYETRGGYVPYQEQLECLIRHGLLSRDGGPIEELRSIVLSSVQLDGVNTRLIDPINPTVLDRILSWLKSWLR